MKKEIPYMTNRPLADMHLDGVRFNPRIKEALKNQSVESVTYSNENSDAQ